MTVDGVDYWNINVPSTEPELKNPEYLSLMFSEHLDYPRVLAKRFAPTLYTIEADGHMATVKSANVVGYAVPICRDAATLRAAFYKPDKGQMPKFPKLNSKYKILRCLKRMLDGPGSIIAVNYYTGSIVEHFQLQQVINVLTDA